METCSNLRCWKREPTLGLSTPPALGAPSLKTTDLFQLHHFNTRYFLSLCAHIHLFLVYYFEGSCCLLFATKPPLRMCYLCLITLWGDYRFAHHVNSVSSLKYTLSVCLSSCLIYDCKIHYLSKLFFLKFNNLRLLLRKGRVVLF